MQINNLKLLSKFHVARRNRFQVIIKSLTFHTHYLKNDTVKTKKHAMRASVVSIKRDHFFSDEIKVPYISFSKLAL